MNRQAPERFTQWLTENQHHDDRTGLVYRYHGRSDRHSRALCRLILEDLIGVCHVLGRHAQSRKVVYRINLRHQWPQSGKTKTLDLAIGLGEADSIPSPMTVPILEGTIHRVLISLEAKSVMTEHVKAQPRVFDELSSSHVIVHSGDNQALAAGVTVVNISKRFVSPLRQVVGQPTRWTEHRQPDVSRRMVEHLRGLPIRTSLEQAGFDGYITLVVDCDNQNPSSLWTDPPAPQPGDRDHYDTFLDDLARGYSERFFDL